MTDRTFVDIFERSAIEPEAADLRPRYLAEPTDSGEATGRSLTWLDPATGWPAGSENETIQFFETSTIGADTIQKGLTYRAVRDTAGGIAADWVVWGGGSAALTYNVTHSTGTAIPSATGVVNGWWPVELPLPAGESLTTVTPTPAANVLILDRNTGANTAIVYVEVNGANIDLAFTTAAETAQLIDYDVGTVVPFVNGAPYSDAYLPMSGGTFNDADYTYLAAKIQAGTFLSGTDNGDGTFTLADWNTSGRFLGGLEGETAGTLQDSQNKAHTHAHTRGNNSNASVLNGAAAAGLSFTGVNAGGFTSTTAAEGGTNARPQTARVLWAVKSKPTPTELAAGATLNITNNYTQVPYDVTANGGGKIGEAVSESTRIIRVPLSGATQQIDGATLGASNATYFHLIDPGTDGFAYVAVQATGAGAVDITFTEVALALTTDTFQYYHGEFADHNGAAGYTFNQVSANGTAIATADHTTFTLAEGFTYRIRYNPIQGRANAQFISVNIEVDGAVVDNFFPISDDDGNWAGGAGYEHMIQAPSGGGARTLRFVRQGSTGNGNHDAQLIIEVVAKDQQTVLPELFTQRSITANGGALVPAASGYDGVTTIVQIPTTAGQQIDQATLAASGGETFAILSPGDGVNPAVVSVQPNGANVDLTFTEKSAGSATEVDHLVGTFVGDSAISNTLHNETDVGFDTTACDYLVVTIHKGGEGADNWRYTKRIDLPWKLRHMIHYWDNQYMWFRAGSTNQHIGHRSFSEAGHNLVEVRGYKNGPVGYAIPTATVAANTRTLTAVGGTNTVDGQASVSLLESVGQSVQLGLNASMQLDTVTVDVGTVQVQNPLTGTVYVVAGATDPTITYTEKAAGTYRGRQLVKTQGYGQGAPLNVPTNAFVAVPLGVDLSSAYVEVDFRATNDAHVATKGIHGSAINLGQDSGALLHWYDTIYIRVRVDDAAALTAGNIQFLSVAGTLEIVEIRVYEDAENGFVIPTGTTLAASRQVSLAGGLGTIQGAATAQVLEGVPSTLKLDLNPGQQIATVAIDTGTVIIADAVAGTVIVNAAAADPTVTITETTAATYTGLQLVYQDDVVRNTDDTDIVLGVDLSACDFVDFTFTNGGLVGPSGYHWVARFNMVRGRLGHPGLPAGYNNQHIDIDLVDETTGTFHMRDAGTDADLVGVRAYAVAENGFVIPTGTVAATPVQVTANGGANQVNGAPNAQVLEGVSHVVRVDLPAGQIIDAAAVVFPAGVTGTVVDANTGRLSVEVAPGTGNVDITAPLVAGSVNAPISVYVNPAFNTDDGVHVETVTGLPAGADMSVAYDAIVWASGNAAYAMSLKVADSGGVPIAGNVTDQGDSSLIRDQSYVVLAESTVVSNARHAMRRIWVNSFVVPADGQVQVTIRGHGVVRDGEGHLTFTRN